MKINHKIVITAFKHRCIVKFWLYFQNNWLHNGCAIYTHLWPNTECSVLMYLLVSPQTTYKCIFYICIWICISLISSEVNYVFIFS